MGLRGAVERVKFCAGLRSATLKRGLGAEGLSALARGAGARGLAARGCVAGLGELVRSGA